MKFSIFFGGEVQIFVSLESSFVGSCLDLGEIFLKLWTYQRKLLRWKGFRSLFFCFLPSRLRKFTVVVPGF